MWATCAIALAGILLLRHLVALPTPALSDLTLQTVLRAATPDGRWRAVHFMYRSPMSSLLRYLILPREVTTFERQYLARVNKVALGFFALHPPVFAVVGLLAVFGTRVLF